VFRWAIRELKMTGAIGDSSVTSLTSGTCPSHATCVTPKIAMRRTEGRYVIIAGDIKLLQKGALPKLSGRPLGG
jgi:hypothetical protein